MVILVSKLELEPSS